MRRIERGENKKTFRNFVYSVTVVVVVVAVSGVAVVKMPDRFKVTKTDAPEIDATYNSILKDEEAAAVLGKLLPPSNANESCLKKGKSRTPLSPIYSHFYFLTLLIRSLVSPFIFTISHRLMEFLFAVNTIVFCLYARKHIFRVHCICSCVSYAFSIQVVRYLNDPAKLSAKMPNTIDTDILYRERDTYNYAICVRVHDTFQMFFIHSHVPTKIQRSWGSRCHKCPNGLINQVIFSIEYIKK